MSFFYKGPENKCFCLCGPYTFSTAYSFIYIYMYISGFFSCFCLNCVALEKAMAPHSTLLPGKSHGWRSLVGCSPWGCEELDTTEPLPFHFSLSCIEERNGNPLECSCLENPRDSGAWWAAVYGVAQSRTRLKQLSSSSSSQSMAPHSSTLAWKIPWTEEPDKLQPMASQKSWR